MIKRELAIFLFVGTSTVAVDFITYHSMVKLGLMGVDVAKATGFLVGTLFAYLANRYWTFCYKSYLPGSVWRFVLLYTCTLVTNVLVNTLALDLLSNMLSATQLAFLIATGVTASLNFFGMKWFVFGSIHNSEF